MAPEPTTLSSDSIINVAEEQKKIIDMLSIKEYAGIPSQMCKKAKEAFDKKHAACAGLTSVQIKNRARSIRMNLSGSDAC